MKKYRLSFLIIGLLIVSFVLIIIAIRSKLITDSVQSETATSNSTPNNSTNTTNSSLNSDSSSQPIVLSFTKLEIANTSAQREQGLQNRTELCADCGMIFVFETPQPLSFWMKNTTIPLDILFIDSDGVVVKIHENTIPLKLSPTYNSGVNAQYALEVNAGFARDHSLKAGTHLDLDSIINEGEAFD